MVGGQGLPRVSSDSRAASVSLENPSECAVMAPTAEEARMHLEVVEKLFRKRGGVRDAYLSLRDPSTGRVTLGGLRDRLG